MPTPYHHGDLRRSLIDQAVVVLAERGVGGLSLRDLARRVGVSAAAPYHHFSSKADLVAAVAQDAMADLDAAMEAAAERTRGQGPRAQLSAIGVVYVLFAVDSPERFRLAFRPEMNTPYDEMVSGQSLPDDVIGFRQLVRVVRQIEPDPDRQQTAAIAAWSVAHGLAALLVDGPLRALAGDRDHVQTLAEEVLA